MTATATRLGTRAVLRFVDPGHDDICTGCRLAIRWRAAANRRQVIANVYRGKRWDRVEHWHHDCYIAAGEPHGAPTAPRSR